MLPNSKNLLDCEPRTSQPNGWFDLDDWVGPDRPSRRADIAKIEGILANSGDYSLERAQGPTAYWGIALDDGIRAYQRRNGLAVDGVLRPGGPTIEHMRRALGGVLDGYDPPTPDEIDAHHNIVGADNSGTIEWRGTGATLATPVPSAEALAALGIDTAPRQPPGTKVAGLWAMQPLPQPPANFTAPSLPAPSLLAPLPGRRFPIPARPGIVPGSPPPLIPPPANDGGKPVIHPPPRFPNHTGHPAPPREGGTTETFPAELNEQETKLVNEIIEGILPSVFEIKTADGRFDNRGKKSTVEANSEVAKYLKEWFANSPLIKVYEHFRGTNFEGRREKYLPEMVIESLTRKIRRADVTYKYTGNDGRQRYFHANTVSTDSKGGPTKAELEAGRDIASAEETGGVALPPKPNPGETMEAYIDRVRPILDESLDKLAEDIVRRMRE